MPHVTRRAGLAGVAVLAAVLVSAVVQTSSNAPPAAAATPAAPAVQAAATWTGTWSVSPQGGSATFRQQTLRQIAHTSISGTAARVQLSNAYSGQPVTIADVHVARRTSGSSVDTSTDRAATFGGTTPTAASRSGRSSTTGT
jgi:hypothetical protein